MFPEEFAVTIFKGAIAGKREMHLLLLLLLSLSFAADIVDENVLVMGLL
jgi:hypothetical protein